MDDKVHEPPHRVRVAGWHPRMANTCNVKLLQGDAKTCQPSHDLRIIESGVEATFMGIYRVLAEWRLAPEFLRVSDLYCRNALALICLTGPDPKLEGCDGVQQGGRM